MCVDCRRKKGGEILATRHVIEFLLSNHMEGLECLSNGYIKWSVRVKNPLAHGQIANEVILHRIDLKFFKYWRRNRNSSARVNIKTTKKMQWLGIIRKKVNAYSVIVAFLQFNDPISNYLIQFMIGSIVSTFTIFIRTVLFI